MTQDRAAPVRALRTVRNGAQGLGPLLGTLVLWLALLLFFRWAFPWLSAQRWRGQGEVFAVFPSFLSWLYSAVVAVVAVAYINCNCERRRAFKRPLEALFRGDPTHPVGLPLVRFVILFSLPIVLVQCSSTPAVKHRLQVVKSARMPKGPDDEIWAQAPISAVSLFRRDSATSPARHGRAFLRAVRQGRDLAVLVDYVDEGGREQDSLPGFCQLWWHTLQKQGPNAGVWPRPPGFEDTEVGTEIWHWSTDKLMVQGDVAVIGSASVVHSMASLDSKRRGAKPAKSGARVQQMLPGRSFEAATIPVRAVRRSGVMHLQFMLSGTGDEGLKDHLVALRFQPTLRLSEGHRGIALSPWLETSIGRGGGEGVSGGFVLGVWVVLIELLLLLLFSQTESG